MHEGTDHPTKDDVAAAFGAALRQRRKVAGITQEYLAEVASLTPTFVSMLERGQYQPTLQTAFALAAGLRIDVAELVADARDELRTRLQG